MRQLHLKYRGKFNLCYILVGPLFLVQIYVSWSGFVHLVVLLFMQSNASWCYMMRKAEPKSICVRNVYLSGLQLAVFLLTSSQALIVLVLVVCKAKQTRRCARNSKNRKCNVLRLRLPDYHLGLCNWLKVSYKD